ncbi:hypothetical protein HWV62_44985 [Athelia sp. TMB]|nr:hypothetical protein HWV62_23308 [Athelia sp. TMB]KAF7978709.1 hypothetical protein HWV62_44985 [Athelia sp. TMB]
MPPKRKRVDADPEVTSAPAASARTTRGSAAKANEGVIQEPVPKKSNAKTSASAKSSKTAVAESEDDEPKESKPAQIRSNAALISQPVVKKAKSSKVADKKTKATKKPKFESKIPDNRQPLSHHPPPRFARCLHTTTTTSMPFFLPCCSDDATRSDDEAGTSKVAPKKSKESPRTSKEIIAKDAPPSQPYTPGLALSLFNSYVDPDTADTEEPVIGPEGFEKLCGDAQIPLDGALPLLLAWMLDAQEMAKISKGEWVKGTTKLQISSLYAFGTAIRDVEALLLLDKPPIKRPTSKAGGKSEKEPYNRDQYWSYAADKKVAFLKLYTFCFVLAKPPQARNIEMETATAFWSVLLVPRYPIMADVIEFINEKSSYKGANKDLWSMMLEFCQTVSSNLDNYEADGAWPTLLDEFVAWQKAKLA